MNKIFTAALVVACMTLAACGSRTVNTAELDSLSFEVPEEMTPVEQANVVVELLQQQLQQTDPEQVQAISTQIAEQVAAFIAAGDEEAATRYTTVISDFISKNAAKLQEAGVPTAIAAALASVKGVPEELVNAATQAALKADSASVSLQQAAEAAKQVIDAIPDEMKETAKKQAGELIDEAAAAAKKELGL